MNPFPKDFEKYLVTEYFKHGSINKVYSSHQYNLPISFAGYDRLLTKFGVVKSAGPNSQLSESLTLLSKLATYKIPLERLYHHFAPQSIQVSTKTLHRILHYTRLGLTRRQGVALLISNINSTQQILTGFETKPPLSSLGKKGDLALPMGHSKVGEDPRLSITRILQQEVFTQAVLEKKFPFNLVPAHPKPIMFLNLADVKVSVYHLEIDPKCIFSSFKLNKLEFRNFDQIQKHSLRPGVLEICENYFNAERVENPNFTPEILSNLNSNLLALAEVKAP